MGRYIFLQAKGYIPCRLTEYRWHTTVGKNSEESGFTKFINDKQFDVTGLTETNVHWRSIPVEQRLHERTRGWWENLHISYAYFDKYPYASADQVGGSAMFSINSACHRVIKQGKDLTGMGRWTWTMYNGKGNRSLRIITAYRPVKNTTGLRSVYSQQKWYYQSRGQDPCPRSTFLEDLCAEVKLAMETGQQIVVALDANEDVWHGDTQAAFQALGLTEINIHRHGDTLASLHTIEAATLLMAFLFRLLSWNLSAAILHLVMLRSDVNTEACG